MGSVSFYKIRLIAFVLIFVLFALITLGLVSYQKVTGIIEEEMGMRAAGVAQAAAHLIQMRMDEYLQISEPEDKDKVYYQEMRSVFREFKASNNLKYILNP